ncbi:MAG: TolC family protein [Planctomycetota bacterium]|nr:MAG: TolC family protein [Planctomycetota bacterium]
MNNRNHGRIRTLALLLLCASWALLPACTPVEKPLGDELWYPGGKKTGAGRQLEKAPSAEKSAELPAGPLDLSVNDAILMALENNREFLIERMNPAIRKTREKIESSAFDTTVTADVGASRSRTEKDTTSSGGYTNSVSRSTDAGVGLSKRFAGGTDVSLELSTARTLSSMYSDEHRSRAGLTFTQALLQGAGTDVNLARLRQARIDTLVSQYELRGFAESLVANVERTYWDYVLAKRNIEIYSDSLKIAQQQLSETKERIKIGKLAGVELAAAEAEAASRKSALIDARSDLAKTRLRLLRMLNPPGGNTWSREVNLRNQPAVPEIKLDDVESYVKVAMRMRPEMNQARLQIKRQELEIVKTRNGLLPRLDLFITLGKSGYADSFATSFSNISDEDSYGISGGISFEFPVRNRSARASHRSARFNLEQAKESLRNLEQLIEVDVRSAYIEVNRAKEQVTASAATRKHREETHKAEVEKFRVGKSTTILVAQAERDLVASRISEIRTIVEYLKSMVELYRLEGALLERRGILGPGRNPADPPDKSAENPEGTTETTPEKPK